MAAAKRAAPDTDRPSNKIDAGLWEARPRADRCSILALVGARAPLLLDHRIRAAIHRPNRAGHVARPARCKEHRNAGDFFGLGVAAERNARDAPGEQLGRRDAAAARFRRDALFHAPGQGQAGIDRVDAYSLLAIGVRET